MTRDLFDLFMPCLFSGLLGSMILGMLAAFLRDFDYVPMPRFVPFFFLATAVLCILGLLGTMTGYSVHIYFLRHPPGT